MCAVTEFPVVINPMLVPQVRGSPGHGSRAIRPVFISHHPLGAVRYAVPPSYLLPPSPLHHASHIHMEPLSAPYRRNTMGDELERRQLIRKKHGAQRSQDLAGENEEMSGEQHPHYYPLHAQHQSLSEVQDFKRKRYVLRQQLRAEKQCHLELQHQLIQGQARRQSHQLMLDNASGQQEVPSEMMMARNDRNGSGSVGTSSRAYADVSGSSSSNSRSRRQSEQRDGEQQPQGGGDEAVCPDMDVPSGSGSGSGSGSLMDDDDTYVRPDIPATVLNAEFGKLHFLLNDFLH